MQNRRSLLSYILINIAISALTTLIVLFIWNRVTALPENAQPKTPITEVASSEAADSAQVFADQLQITTIIAPGDLENERVLIEHNGSEDVLLAGWILEDEDGHRFAFPALELHSGASLQLFSRAGEDSVTRLFWNREDALWSRSESATLIDPNGEAQAIYLIP